MVSLKITRSILLGLAICWLPSVANSLVQSSDDMIEIESDDIQLRWLNRNTMQIIWADQGKEDQGEDQDSSSTTDQTPAENPVESEIADEDDNKEDMLNIADSDADIQTDEEEEIINGELMFLTPSINFPLEEDKEACRFRGKLENHPQARAGIVGCITDPITFVNINIGGKFYVLSLDKEGKTWKKIRNPALDTIHKVRGKRSPYYRAPPPPTSDILVPNEPKPNLLASRSGPPPSAITLPYTLGNILKNHFSSIEQLSIAAYDKSLKNFFGSDSRARRYVKDVYALAEPFLEGESNLDTEVHMKFGPIKYVNENVDADGLCAGARGPSRQVRNVMESQIGNLVPMVIIAEDTGECDGTGYTTGCAYV